MPRGRARSTAARDRRRERALARGATPPAITLAQPELRSESDFIVDFGDLRMVTIDAATCRLVEPAELDLLRRLRERGQPPIIVDSRGRWMRRRDFDPDCGPANSDALFLVMFTEKCSWREIGAVCETHHITTPVTNATHAIEGSVFDTAGNARGGGVLAWCFDEDYARRDLKFLQRCRHVRDAQIVTRQDLHV